MSSLVNNKVSFQNSIKSPISGELSIIETLQLIKSNKYLDVTTQLRSFLDNGNKEKYDQEKSKLNSVTFCGTFNNRRTKSNLKTYNNLIILDIDKLAKKDVAMIKGILAKDVYVLAVWISPSNRGIKGLFKVSYPIKLNKENIDTSHGIAFDIVSEYLKNSYNIILDPSGRDTTRPCFLSRDSDLVLNSSSLSFSLAKSDFETKSTKITKKKSKINIPKKSNKDLLYNPMNRNSSYNRYRMGSVIRFLENRRLSITSTYNDWLQVALAISDSFTFDIGLKYFLKLSSLDSSYNETNCTNFLIRCYNTRKGLVSFNTIVFKAQRIGYIFGN